MTGQAARGQLAVAAALARSLQGTAIRQQLLQCIPYIATIAAMVFYNAWAKLKATRRNL